MSELVSPYDAVIEIVRKRFDAAPSGGNWLDKETLAVLGDRRIGFLAHGEQGCGSESCKCRLDGIEEGLEQAAEGKVGVRP